MSDRAAPQAVETAREAVILAARRHVEQGMSEDGWRRIASALFRLDEALKEHSRTKSVWRWNFRVSSISPDIA